MKEYSKIKWRSTTSKDARSKPTMWLGAYYIDQASCGNSDLEHSDEAAHGWYESDIPRKYDIGGNFIYRNDDVWGSDFCDGTDYYQSEGMPNGYDGIDSVTIALMILHGATVDNFFMFSPGGNVAHGGCTVYSTQMRLGDNNLRYLFLGSCESVQKNPLPVWQNAVSGVRALFGFANVNSAANNEDFGEDFWEHWVEEGVTTTDAFLDASWDASHEAIPVAAWCGPDTDTAARLRDTETYFDQAPVDCRCMATAWCEARNMQAKVANAQIVPALALHFRRTVQSPPELFGILEPNITDDDLIESTSTRGKYEFHKGGENTLRYNKRSGTFDFKTPVDKSLTPVTLTDNEAITLAQAYIDKNQRLLLKNQIASSGSPPELVPVACRDTFRASGENLENYTQVRTAVTVIFRPIINGISTIGTGGVLEITLNGKNQVTRVRSVMRDIASVEQRGDANYDLRQLQQIAEKRAADEISAYQPITNYRIRSTEFGFFCERESKEQETAHLAFRILLEVQELRFKQMVEKIYFLEDLIKAGNPTS